MQHERTNYGVDAPLVIAGLAGGGLAGIAVGSGLVLWSGIPLAASLGLALALAAVVPFVLGLMMIAYALRGKARFRDWMIARHTWRGDEIVLDVGAGRGLMSVAAARRVPRGRVIAIDIWRPEDLSGNGPDALAANARMEGVADRIEIRTQDVRSLDLPDASVDLVTSVLCLHNIEPASERDIACREIARVLKIGGLALIADYTAAESYVRAFRAAGLEVRGPINAVPVALSLMYLVEARKVR